MERLRMDRHSISDQSDIESQLEYNPTLRLLHENEERRRGRDQFGQNIHDGRSDDSPYFGEDDNECRWQRLKESCKEKREQWKLFDQEITDTMRQADAFVCDKKIALIAAADKE